LTADCLKNGPNEPLSAAHSAAREPTKNTQGKINMAASGIIAESDATTIVSLVLACLRTW